MMRTAVTLCALMFILWMHPPAVFGGILPIRFQSVLPYVGSKGQVVQDFLVESDSSFGGMLLLRCYRFSSAADSLLIYSRAGVGVRIREGAQVLQCLLREGGDSTYLHKDIGDILLKTGFLPAGRYRICATLNAGGQRADYSFLHNVDSSLSRRSAARREVEAILGDKEKRAGSSGLKDPVSLLQRPASKIGRAFRSRGLSPALREHDGARYIDIYYKDWFIGYYKTGSLGLPDRVGDQPGDPVFSGVRTELGNIESVFTQVRELQRSKGEDKTVSGELGFSGQLGSGQEEGSASDNNFYELRGNIEFPLMDIPVSVEGYYTSQDRDRKAKASYIKFHYDTRKAKEALLKLINGYNDQYEQTVARGKGLEGVYASYLARLGAEQDRLLTELRKETGLADIGLDTSGLRAALCDTLRRRLPDTGGSVSLTAARARQISDSADRLYERTLERYHQAQKLEQDIARYRQLLDQYRNTTRFDSLLAYDKVKDLEDAEDLSYKELSKKAENLLPEGKARRLITGLTHFDGGIFTKEVSAYTLSGQTIKGVDAGYDLGFCQTAFTAGRIEYIGRDGNVDKYTGYSGRVMFKPGKKQKASLIYYGYTPGRQMLSEDPFFKEMGASMPSFGSPVHIVSATWSGSVKKYISYEAEAATSFRKQAVGGQGNTPFRDKMAWTIKAEGDIPGTAITVDAGYEHAGKGFENNSAPVNLSGTERYHIGAKSSFLKNFLTLGIEYNYLEQQSFSSTGGNTKWGFELKTSSKRYPSLSVSYKPFATFRSYSDTLNIPQRPLVGEVWTARASYQVKRKTHSIRFMGVYNRNTSTMDTTGTAARMLQLSCIYLKDKSMAMISLGSTDTHSDPGGEGVGVHRNMQFMQLSGSYVLSRQWTVQGGLDMGVSGFGLSKYGANVGCGYSFRKVPLQVRTAVRYNSYRLLEDQPWRQLVTGTMDIVWRFKFRVGD